MYLYFSFAFYLQKKFIDIKIDIYYFEKKFALIYSMHMSI